jgi:hypothetical protein
MDNNNIIPNEQPLIPSFEINDNPSETIAPADRAALADTVKPVVRRDWYPSGTMEQALSLEDRPEWHADDTANTEIKAKQKDLIDKILPKIASEMQNHHNEREQNIMDI